MDQISEEIQMIAAEKVLEEMKNAEKNLMSWNAYWRESYDNVVVPTEYLCDYYDLNDVRECTKFFGEDINPYYLRTDKALGIPLKRFVSNPIYTQDICTIKWTGIVTNNSTRKIVFNNNGEITLEKDYKKTKTNQHRRTIKYDANYNVLSDNFSFNITIVSLNPGYCNSYNYDRLLISLNDGLLIKKYNGIEIIDDLNNGIKHIKIVKEYDENNNASVEFKVLLNSDNLLEKGSVVINTHKGNGKVNGTYKIDVSKNKNVSANFYSRKGVKIDLTTNPILLGNSSELMLLCDKTELDSDKIISDYVQSTKKIVENNFGESVIKFDNTDFNMNSVIEVETKIINILKSLKGEIPLNGLVDRIDKVILLVERKKKEKRKMLKLTLGSKE